MPRKAIIFAIFLVGFTAMSAQIVFLRQLIVVFYGNEISLGLLLGAWLFWGAVGSWLVGKLSDRIKHRQFVFAALQILLGFILFGTIFFIRLARKTLDILPGELISLVPMIAFSFFVLSLICVILGFLFALACRIYPEKTKGALGIGRVYIWEALGAVCGGCLVSFLFIRFLDAFYIILGLASLNFISAYLLQRNLSQPKFIRASRNSTLILMFILFVLVISQKAKEFQRFSLQQQWQPFTPLAIEDSIYSNIVLTKEEKQYSFFTNGLYLFTVPDEAASEEAVHFALLETADPKRVLLIGGGISGLCEEILKHPVDALDYVELDPQIIKLATQFLPAERLNFLKDGRTTIFHQDGRMFIKQVKSLSDFAPYDTIIVFLGDPCTAQINRFYTQEFFQEVKAALAPDGVFSFSLSSSENFITKQQQKFLSSIYKSLTSVFSDVKIIPTDTAYFLASNKKDILTYDYSELIRRLQKRSIATKFVREYYLFTKLSKERIEYLETKIKEEEKAEINSDFHPVSYYYDMVLWSSYFGQPWHNLFDPLTKKNLWTIFVLAYFCILLFSFWPRRKTPKPEKVVLLAVCTTGLTELSFQVVILLSFQIIYGYLYYKLGVILTFFMVGLVLGSWLITKKLEQLSDPYGLFIKTQEVIAVYPLALALIFYILHGASANQTVNWLGSNIIFPALPIISGFVGGFQFPLANKIILKNNDIVGRTAGLTYGIDLLGSCLGALLVSAFLVPILGIVETCVAVALLNTIVLAALIINRGR